MGTIDSTNEAHKEEAAIEQLTEESTGESIKELLEKYNGCIPSDHSFICTSACVFLPSGFHFTTNMTYPATNLKGCNMIYKLDSKDWDCKTTCKEELPRKPIKWTREG